MPRLTTAIESKTDERVQFVFSIPLDLLNAMYFTYLAKDHEGVEGLPIEARNGMDADFREEFDAMYEFPLGMMGLLGDTVWAHPEAWPSVDALLRHVRSLPLGIGEPEGNAGIQGLLVSALNHCYNVSDWQPVEAGSDPRATFAEALRRNGADVEAGLALFDDPEGLRERAARLIERYYEEFYKPELPKRRGCLERSAAAHQGMSEADVVPFLKQVSGRSDICLESGVCPGPYERVLLAPSLDMGPYMSCAVIESPSPVHGMYYPCEERFKTPGAEHDADETVRMARVYKALSDEQRLRILRILQEREMYAQEIVERTGLHQSVVSRHLTFLRAVGLLRVRKESNMKFFSINTDMREELSRTLELFAPRAGQ